MPVQINEIIIRAVVGASTDKENMPDTTCGEDNSGSSGNDNDLAILAEKIMEIIRAKQER
jgi:hypothetical protein